MQRSISITFLVFIFIELAVFQRINKYCRFACLLYQTRKVLSVQGFENVNPENDNFQKKFYLD